MYDTEVVHADTPVCISIIIVMCVRCWFSISSVPFVPRVVCVNVILSVGTT